MSVDWELVWRVVSCIVVSCLRSALLSFLQILFLLAVPPTCVVSLLVTGRKTTLSQQQKHGELVQKEGKKSVPGEGVIVHNYPCNGC